MFLITTADPINAAKERIPSGAYETRVAAMLALRRWREDNGTAAQTLLVLRGVKVVDGGGRVLWDEMNGEY